MTSRKTAARTLALDPRQSSLYRFTLVLPLLLTALILIALNRPAEAMQIKSVKSPGGIEAWLVEDHSNPMMAMRFSFEGGSAQDPAGKDGVANFVSSMLDEGAGKLDASTFQEKLEDLAVRLSFSDTQDAFYGNFETLTANRDEATELLRLAINEPTFDKEAAERIRQQILAGIVYAAKDPDKVAAQEWNALAFGDHAYGRRPGGTEESVTSITTADLDTYRKKVFARSNLRVVAVGDITEAELGAMLDKVFGKLPEKADLVAVAMTAPATGGKTKIIEMDVPQSVAVFGFGAMPRKDPDFLTAFVLNQLIGGGGFASRLMEEVREKRGLAYSVYSYLQPMRHASIFSGGVATRNDAVKTSIDLIRQELEKVAAEGPNETEFANAKSYLTGSYALRFDTNVKIATQLLGLMEEGYGTDYVEKRNALIEAITLDDAKRVAKRLLDTNNMIVTIVGKPVTAVAGDKG
ncbi:MAG: peptidase M16 [Hyphomicrobium sp. 32-62-53]|nr:MAG: peptidase M16 [Hyphomicrobium sp. 12-62-95]OYX97857.1 MAG: peptidase M16 [Hyphomicrobium sp. 32-62-53]